MGGSCSTRRVRRDCWTYYDSLMATLDHREDIDQSFSYYTKQEVMFRDRKLGITYYVLTAMVALYIIGYMFLYREGYLMYEQAKGATVTHVFGDAVASSNGKPGTRYFSAEEVSFPGLENGAIFIATRQRVYRQKRGFCEDFNMPCTSKAACTVGGNGTCTENGYCKEASWCDQGDPEMYELETHDMQIWLRSTIQYVKLAPSMVFSTDANHPRPTHGENVFTIRELLMMCEPLPVRFEEVAELGAIIEVQLIWECAIKSNNIFTWLGGLFSSDKKKDNEDHECKPTIKARRLDTIFDPDNIGFRFGYPEYLDSNERDRNEVRGIRVVFITAGIGRKISVQESITKASLGASLFGIAKIIADLMMIKLFYLRKKYYARKFEASPDFSEHLAYLEERKKFKLPIDEIDVREKKVREDEEKWMKKLDEEDD